MSDLASRTLKLLDGSLVRGFVYEELVDYEGDGFPTKRVISNLGQKLENGLISILGLVV